MFFSTLDDKNVEEQKERFASLNENAPNFNVTKGISDGTKSFYVVSLGDTLWYNSVKHMKASLEMMYKESKQIAPFFIGHLDNDKLRVEHSATNVMVYPPAKNYQKGRWMTVIATSHIQPQEELTGILLYGPWAKTRRK